VSYLLVQGQQLMTLTPLNPPLNKGGKLFPPLVLPLLRGARGVVQNLSQATRFLYRIFSLAFILQFNRDLLA
jgi:hypothetical protein